MCNTIRFKLNNYDYQIEFKERNSKLPVLTKDHDIVLLPWGRRQKERGRLPLGGWARLDDIKQGNWNAFQPRPVKLPIQNFMEIDIESRRHWFQIVQGQWIQGLVARQEQEMRAYIVTISPTRLDARFFRWPRIVWF